MMNCEQIRARLEDHLDGRLAAREAAGVAEHLSRCGDCREAHNGLAALAVAARALPREIAPTRDLWPAVAQRLPSRRELRVRWLRENARPLSTFGLLAAAAVVALILLPATPPPTPVDDGSVAEAGVLDANYRDVRAGLARALDASCPELTVAACAAVKGSLKVLDDSAAALGKALRGGGGGDPRETLLLINNYEMTIDRARGLTNRLTRI
jgi:anti-sigma factor RsiW